MKSIASGEKDIRIIRKVDVKGLRVMGLQYYECDSSELETLMVEGKQPFTVSVCSDGLVRFGHLAVLVAMRLGWDKIEAEVVFPVEWLTCDTSPVIQCSDIGLYSRGIYPVRTDAQRRASAMLRQLIKGQEERYPILVVDYPPNDVENIPVAKPVPATKLREYAPASG